MFSTQTKLLDNVGGVNGLQIIRPGAPQGLARILLEWRALACHPEQLSLVILSDILLSSFADAQDLVAPRARSFADAQNDTRGRSVSIRLMS